MNDDLNHIDKLFKEGLENYESGRSSGLWWKLSLKLFLWRFGRILMITAFAGGVVITGYVVWNSFSDRSVISDENLQETFLSHHQDNLSAASALRSDETSPGPTETADEQFKTGHDVSSAVDPSETDEPLPVTGSRELDHRRLPLSSVWDMPDATLSGEKNAAEQLLCLHSIRAAGISLYDMPPIATAMPKNIMNNKYSSGDSIPLSLFDENELRKYWRLISADFTFSPFMYQKSLQSHAEYDHVTGIRRLGELPQVSFAAGAGLNFHKKKWFIHAGIRVAQYNENIRYRIPHSRFDPIASYYKPDTIRVWIYDPPFNGQEMIFRIDTVFVPVYRNEIIRHDARNRITYINVPLLAGYRLEKNKLGFEPAAGLSVGIPVTSSGLLYMDHEIITGLPKPSAWYAPTVSIIAQGGITYDAGRSLSFLIQPWYSIQLNNSHKAAIVVEQRIRAAGINAGIKVKLDQVSYTR